MPLFDRLLCIATPALAIGLALIALTTLALRALA